ncbi:hypothetical protein [Streptomyces atriruber]|uniref:hypothetical protein n=1 Tax=Streptomyces atriruber TaxID=545121 RepID=UPI0006E1EDB5|nr:hypothetical protein [Streptomyces atriruber]
MNGAAVDKAVFLMRETHQSPEATRRALRDYFPRMEFTDRVRHVRAAYAVIQGGRKVVRPRLSDLERPSSFMVAHERHGFTD